MIKLPSIFSDGMVLAKKARIWGFSDEKTVTLTFLGQTYQVTPDSEGHFSIPIESTHYGGPYPLSIGEHTLNHVYVGRVYLCAGQSNMEQPLTRSIGLEHHIQPDIRIHAFQVEKGFQFGEAATDTNARWQVAQGSFLRELFAVPYFFARKLLNETSTPIGLINVAAGGTPIEAWLPETIINTFPDLAQKLAPFKERNHLKTLEQQGHERHAQWYDSLIFDSDTPFKATDLLVPVMDTPGVVVYQKTLPYLAGEIKLNLGRAADSLRVFINGQSVGQVSYQYPPAIFHIPEGIFQPHLTNTIEIQLIGETQPPHFIPGKTYELSANNGTLDISCNWQYRITQVKEKLEPGFWFYHIPTCCYNYMLAPVLGYGIDGILWYQGESNTGEPAGYQQKFELLVNHLRQHFGSVPVIYTQLANFRNPHLDTGTGWPVLREAQRQCLSISDTAMAVTIDCGEYNDLHPVDKKTVGERLALLLMDPHNTGPVVAGHTLDKGLLTIHFDRAEGLWAANGRPVLRLDDDRFAVATIIKNQLVAQVGDAKIVRFGWTDCPSVTLYNAKKLPASPFELVLN